MRVLITAAQPGIHDPTTVILPSARHLGAESSTGESSPGAATAAPADKEARGEASPEPALVDAANTPPVGELVRSGPDEEHHEASTGGNGRVEASPCCKALGRDLSLAPLVKASRHPSRPER
jgi:hypothetical protein